MRTPRSALALLPLIAGLLGNGGDAEKEALALLRAVESRYEGVRDFQGRFVQTARVASLGRDEVSSGRVWVKRPGRMRWEYREPEARVIAIDGETLRMYSPEEAQLQIASLEQGAFSPTALDFLFGELALAEHFRPSLGTPHADGTLRLELTPRAQARFQRLELWVDPLGHQLRGSLLVDVLGNRTELRFAELAENLGIADERFSVEVPAETEIVDLR